ncbi:hypothetical protein Dimus_003198 [Dionaea muscipula]
MEDSSASSSSGGDQRTRLKKFAGGGNLKSRNRAKENDMQFDVEEAVHQVEEQDVDGNAQEPLHQSESRQAANDTDIASKDTDVAAALLLTNLAAATSIGTTAATSVGNTELLAADVSATLVPATDVSATMDDRTGDGQNQHIDAWMVYLKKKIMKKGNPEYALVDSYFFIYIENLWKNWDPDSEPDPSQASNIPEDLMNYVWGLNPEWGIEWSVCLMAQSHWVLAHINLEEWTIEIYDSLAHKTPKNPGQRLASFEGMRTLLPLILDEAGYFKRSGRRRRIDHFQTRRIPPENVPKQEDDDSCGIWTLYFAERIVSGMAIKVDLQQKYITSMRKHYALQIFANSDPIED